MDQDSTGNGSGGERRNWRERLGINKDLPRLSEEFKSERAKEKAEPKLIPTLQPSRPAAGAAKQAAPVTAPPRPAAPQPPARQPAQAQSAPQQPPAPQAPVAAQPTPPQAAPQQPARAPQPAPAHRPGPPVTKPAPMAPRPAPKPAEAARPAPPRPAAPQPMPPRPAAPPPAAQRPAPPPQRPAPEPSADQFAERLRAQREAAERLAQQRMQSARAQALAPPPPPPPRSQPPAQPQAAGERPKFTFAQEEIIQAQRESTPPRAPVPPPAYGARPAYTGAYQPPAQPYGRMPPPPYQPPRSYAPDYRPVPPPAYPDQMAPRRTWQEAPVDARAPAPLPVGEEEDVDRRPPPRAPMPAQRGREEAYAEDDLDDVFDEAETRRPRRDRARAEDYSAAYRGYEDDYEEEEPRRRSGPLILLLSLVAVALIAAALIVWYKKDGLITTGDRGNVPVITAPQEPVKTQPQPTEQQEQATQQTSDQLQVQPVRRKQIYDRILGEETLEPERIVPTEEQPQLPTQNQDATGQQQGTEPLPLPLPPPPTNNGQQGNLEPPQSTGKTVLDQAANPNQEVVAEPASNTGTLSEGKSDSEQAASDLNIPVPEVPANQTVGERGNIPVEQPSEQQQGEQIIDTNQQPKTTQAPQQTEVVEEPQPPKQQEEVVTPPQQKAAVEQPVDNGSGPIQLSPLAPQGTQLPQPVQQPQQVLAPPLQTDQAVRKPTRPGGREDDPLEGQRVPFSSNATQQAQGTQQLNTVSDLALQPVIQPQPQQQQVASIEQPQQQQVATIEQPQPQQSQSAAVGYVVQLASFRTEAEAQTEYQRLAQRHAGLLSGLTPRIQKSDLGASGTFFRLSVGALPSSAAATKLCNSLIAAGEKDCLVRRL